MRMGRYIKYGIKFWNGREQFYIEKGYMIGKIRFRLQGVILEIDEAEEVVNLIKDNLEDN
jgi:hypothetical protein